MRGRQMKKYTDFYILGIDPGYNGAVAQLKIDGLAQAVYVTNIQSCPTYLIDRKVQRMDRKLGKTVTKRIKQTVYDKQKMFHILKTIKNVVKPNAVYAVLERAQAMQEQGVVSTFQNGVGYGLWEMALIALEIPYITVPPITWARKALAQAPEELIGKQRTIHVAQMRFPGVSFVPPRRRVPNDGWADAVNIAYYGYEAGIDKFSPQDFTGHPSSGEEA